MLKKFKKTTRTLRDLRRHYAIEKALAEKLRRAPRDVRRRMYSEVYDELYRSVPALKTEIAEARPHDVRIQLKTLEPFLCQDMKFLEIGPGDCSLSVAVAQRVKRAFATDVSAEVRDGWRGAWPKNLSFVKTDGIGLPISTSSVDLAYSHQLMEHLHPDDAIDQLRDIFRTLKPGGRYLCVTPNRLYGPSDISGFFDDVATGLHLKEYTNRELIGIFSLVGFDRIRVLAGAGGTLLLLPAWTILWLERLVGLLPRRLSRRIAGWLPVRAMLGIRILAQKPKSSA
jgi:SAM-dependent methyltransferase